MATKTNTKTETNQTQGETTDGPLLDNLNAFSLSAREIDALAANPVSAQ